MTRCILLLLAILNTAALADSEPSHLARMVQTEHDFNAASASEGQRAAFLRYVAPDGMLLNPGPVAAMPILTERKDGPGTLAWYPEHAVISTSGALGYTTGPWSYNVKGEAVANGHFVTLWQQQSDGSWRAALDGGISHPPQSPAPADLDPGKLCDHDISDEQPTAAQVESAIASVAEVDTRFEALRAREGWARAFEEFGDNELRLYREGVAPTIGLAGVVQQARALPTSGAGKREVLKVSGSLAYSAGQLTRASVAQTDKGANDGYLRIWRLNGTEWKLVLDLISPAPTEQ